MDKSEVLLFVCRTHTYFGLASRIAVLEPLKWINLHVMPTVCVYALYLCCLRQ